MPDDQQGFTLWVDADACPKAVREILIKAAVRTDTPLVFVANHSFFLPKYPQVRLMMVPSGFDKADQWLSEHAKAGDLLVSSDLPLAAEVIDKQVMVITPRGERLSAANIRAKVMMRDFNETLRFSGVQTGGQAPFSHADKQQFANALDTLLRKARP